MAGVYSLAVNGTLIVPTRRPDLNATVVAGNLAQCKPVISSNGTTLPGQYPVAAVDSSNGTAWQPSVPSPSFIIVDLEVQQSLSGVHINWGDVPARSFEVLVGNDTDTFTSVEILLGNITDAEFSVTGRYSLSRKGETHSRYVQLVVNGTYGDETVGATVAEFAVL